MTLTLGVLAAPRAHAQATDADALFARGKQLMAEGRLADACEAFEASNRLDPRAGTLIWIGECRARNHQLASARNAYREALVRVRDPRKKAIATSRLAAIEDRLSYLVIAVADDHRLSGLTIARDGQPLEIEAWNRGVPVDGGEYAITASAPDHATWTATVTVPPELGRVRVEVPRLDELAPPQVPPAIPGPPREPRPGPPPGPAPAPADAGPPSRWTARRQLALGLLAGAAAAWTTGAVLGVEARHRERDALALCPGGQTTCGDARRANQLLDDGARRALGANLAFGVATALTLGAGALWLTGAPETAGVAISPSLGPGTAGVSLSGRL